jgi:hypothetical protein
MIAIQPETGFVVYLALMFLGLCAAGIGELWRARVHDWRVSEEQLGECSECGLTFVVGRAEKAARCPRCRNRCPAPRK